MQPVNTPVSESGVLSEKEQKFEELRQRAGFFLAPAVFILLWFLPIPGLEDKPVAHRLLAIVGMVITLWISEAIPLAATALLGPTLCVVTGIAPVRDVFKSFADPIIFLFMGSFLLAEAIFHHGLNRRVAFQVLGMKAIGTNPTQLLIALGILSCVLSMWISNTTTVAMMLPVAVSILKEMALRRSEQLGRHVHYMELKFGAGLMLMIVFASTIGGIATPVGTPPNLLAIGMIEKTTGVQIPFFKWMAFGLSLALVLMVFLVIYLKKVYPSEPGLLGQNAAWITAEKLKLGPLTRGEKNVIFAFGITVTLWLLPAVLAIVLGMNHPGYKMFVARFPEPAVALLGALLLFILPVNLRAREFTLTWKEAKRIDWGTILLFGGGIALGELMFSTGLAEWMGNSLVKLMNAQTTLGLVLLFAVIASFITQVASNTASTAMVVPIAIAIAQSAGINPMLPALAAGFAAAMGCMLPVSTPPNAIGYGSGCIPLMQMIKHGFMLTLVALAAIVTIVVWLVPMMFPQ